MALIYFGLMCQEARIWTCGTVSGPLALTRASRLVSGPVALTRGSCETVRRHEHLTPFTQDIVSHGC